MLFLDILASAWWVGMSWSNSLQWLWGIRAWILASHCYSRRAE